MSSQPDKIARRNVRTSSISTVIGISLVLFMLGTLGLILLNAQKVSEYVKENVQIQVYLYDTIPDSEALAFKAEVTGLNYVKDVKYTGKAEAAQKLQEDLGEDFLTFLGYNPLSPSIDIHLKAEFVTIANVEKAIRNLRSNPMVADVVYNKEQIQQINANAELIALIMLAFSGLLLLISIALINNTIRLAIYSKRFVIKTMQLVGATPSFIRRPFLITGTLQGLYAAFIAMALISGLVYVGRELLPDFFNIQDLILFAEVFGGVILMGIAIAWISTFMAVRKYIRLKSDEVF